ncbi:hypothetical protein ASPACDRAFT_55608 [Aspergillus aculeatus ATCC 16872]|uniref:Aminoglycoside phosphotransferase domain-containing protein n=1 Tax=Aspergillus aculeatus (strain ATCC 16872 / CBS 172.66 / WB 5094) TaxID=690307 RepID=A0A1L9WF63_ASPA1|nr:uncharacterized protein ASPACDRAFT_55608 [Aspergillus aculeatus ATCC 16872]OJJ94811.1 hypothetical protein ASPACDRAFT_55608 [Aspergillus aculeatus ATCC 16872]
MYFHNISLASLERVKKEWIALCSASSQGICQLASKYRGRDDFLLRSMYCGFPLPGKSVFLDEKVQNEAILMKFIAATTRIPVLRVIAHGRAEQNPTGLGPFIIMTWVEGARIEDALDQDVDPQTLKILYGEMAEILLELWSLNFSHIGSLRKHRGQETPITTRVKGRPLTLEVNELTRTCGLEDCAPSRVYHSSLEYIHSLLRLQDTHLDRQRNSIYMQSTLFCDDLCPGNVLVDESLHMTGVIDWEFCYAAPAQLAGSIPWWLLLERPQNILNSQGPEAFFRSFLPRANSRGLGVEDDRLSVRMRQSIDTKSAWFYLACRSLDEYCWGKRSSVAERVRSLTTNIGLHKDRENFVRSKNVQSQDYYAELGKATDWQLRDPVQERRQLAAASARPVKPLIDWDATTCSMLESNWEGGLIVSYLTCKQLKKRIGGC